MKLLKDYYQKKNVLSTTPSLLHVIVPSMIRTTSSAFKSRSIYIVHDLERGTTPLWSISLFARYAVEMFINKNNCIKSRFILSSLADAGLVVGALG